MSKTGTNALPTDVRSDFEKQVRRAREVVATARRTADKLATDGSPADRAKARTMRWQATRIETTIRDLTEMVEGTGAWASGSYVKPEKRGEPA
jgi:hypothetical protein